LVLFFKKELLSFLVAADERRVQDFARVNQALRARLNPERGVHRSSPRWGRQPQAARIGGKRVRKDFFFEKKKQKTFFGLGF
jgi:hypothetical protein